MSAAFVCSLYSLFATRRTLLFSLAGLYLAACLFLVSRLELAEDISAFIPDSVPEMAQAFDLLRQAPFVQSLSITVSDPGNLEQTARSLGDALEASGSFTVLSASPSSLLANVEHVYALIPALLPDTAYNDLRQMLAPEPVRAKLEKAKQALSGMRGLASYSFIAKDILGMAALAEKHLSPQAMRSSFSVNNGLLTDLSGEHALIIAKPGTAFTSASHAPALMAQYREVVRRLPESAKASAIGGLRHTEANSTTVQGDLVRVLPLAGLMLLVVFLAMFRNRQGLFVFLVPMVAIASASAGASLFVTSLSGIALGFGSVLMGVTDDYPIHIYCAARSAPAIPQALREVHTPLLAGSCSALLAFAVFLFSAIPGVRQIAVFAITGICSALLFSLVVLPHLLKPGKLPGPATPAAPDALSGEAEENTFQIRNGLLTCLWLGTALLLVAGTSNSSFDGDIRSLSYIPPDVQQDEIRHNAIWGGMNRGGMVVVAGTDLEQALAANDAVWAILGQHKDMAVTSLAPFLPTRATQAEGHARWNAFWEQHREEAIRLVQEASLPLGFDPNAFAPFTDMLATPPRPVMADDLMQTDFSFLFKLLVGGKEGTTHIYTLLDKSTIPDELLGQIAEAGGVFVSGEQFRESLSSITRAEMTQNCLWALALITAISLITFKSIAKAALTLLPLGLSIAVILAVFAFMGIKMTLFHAVAFPLIMMLGLDYGIFVVSYARQGAGSVAFKGIFISAFTTIAGFGCLILARHPALHSLGVTATLGMVLAALASVYLLPWLLNTGKEHNG